MTWRSNQAEQSGAANRRREKYRRLYMIKVYEYFVRDETGEGFSSRERSSSASLNHGDALGAHRPCARALILPGSRRRAFETRPKSHRISARLRRISRAEMPGKSGHGTGTGRRKTCQARDKHDMEVQSCSYLAGLPRWADGFFGRTPTIFRSGEWREPEEAGPPPQQGCPSAGWGRRSPVLGRGESRTKFRDSVGLCECPRASLRR